jgi:hypothetical protein
MSRNNTSNNDDNNNNSDKNKINKNNDNDMWAENLRRNEVQRKKDSQWFSMDPGDKTVLKFLPDFGPTWKDFDNDGKAEKLVYEYKIIDLNNQEAGIRPWDLSKRWSQSVDYHLKQGHYVLKVERIGAGMKTNYYFTPVDGDNSGAATSSS